MSFSSSRVRFWVIAAAVVLFLGTGYSTVFRAGLGMRERSDFTVYWHAGQAVLEGSDIYSAKNPRGWYYMYLPIFAAVVSPLSLLPKPAAAGVWYVINLAALLHLAWMSVRLASGATNRGADRFPFVGAVLVLSAWPWLSALTRGQVSVLLAWCVTIAIDLWVRRRGKPLATAGAGFALAGAVVLKIFPILLVGWLMVTRRWLAIVATGAALCVLILPLPALVFGWESNLKLLQHWGSAILLPLGDATDEQNVRYAQMMNPRIDKNQSVQAVAVRIIAPVEEAGDADLAERTARYLAAGINCAVVLVSAVAVWRVARGRGELSRASATDAQVLSASSVLLLCLFIAPVSWTHNYTLAMLPLAVAVTRGWDQEPSIRRRRYRVAVVLWFIGMLGALAHPIYHVGGHLVAAMGIWVAIVLELLGRTTDQPAVDASSEVSRGAFGPAQPLSEGLSQPSAGNLQPH